MAGPPPQSAPAQSKLELRAEALRRRAEAARRAGGAASIAVAERAASVLGLQQHGAAGIIAGYRPLPGELDPWPLMERLAARGRKLALPRMVGRDRPLAFHAWAPGAPLVRGAFKVMEPPAEAPKVRPAVVLVPLVAFDGRGHRLGYGAGFYDRTLAALRADGGPPVLAVGLAFAAQRVEAVPVEPFDVPLDLVVTERGVVRGGGP
ncbi:MAG TPA: 5-formyltetrahydrofolate cyclo-ligase [Geminicoccaceae bacterium]|nr:5-formyltetrahydrofolate cyclo-ligase [Geminicoccaceae bacterium]